MSAPEEIQDAALDQALAFLGFTNPESVVEFHVQGRQVSVVKLAEDAEGRYIVRSGNPVYEASTYDLA
jgi:hypothetical protein